jgi:hypothetical protein
LHARPSREHGSKMGNDFLFYKGLGGFCFAEKATFALLTVYITSDIKHHADP